jgi:plastocyanin
MRRTTRRTGAALLTLALVTAACGSDDAEEASPTSPPATEATAAEGPDTAPPTTEAPDDHHDMGDPDDAAADLRVGLNNLLVEHTFLAGAAVNEALAGDEAGFEGAAEALDGNSVDLADAVGSIYGDDAGEAFLGLWRSHIDMFVAYTTAVASDDAAGADGAEADLVEYANTFAVFLNGATGIDEAAAEELLLEHVVTLRDTVDILAQGDAEAGFTALREAMAHMGMIADPLAATIADQQDLSGSVDSEMADLRVGLNFLLQEHTLLAAAAVNEALRPDEAGFAAAAGALDANSVDFADTVASVYGDEAGEAFLGLWRSHIDMFVAYTVATADDDAEAADAAEADLVEYADTFAVFLNGATGIDEAAAEELLLEHVVTLRDTVDLVASGESNPFVALREASAHMGMIADPLAAAILDDGSDDGNGEDESAMAGTVEIDGFAFAPAAIEVGVGESVTWSNGDGTIHLITAGTADAPGDAFEELELGEGDRDRVTFDDAGTFAYHCAVHTSMEGTVTVS